MKIEDEYKLFVGAVTMQVDKEIRINPTLIVETDMQKAKDKIYLQCAAANPDIDTSNLESYLMEVPIEALKAMLVIEKGDFDE